MNPWLTNFRHSNSAPLPKVAIRWLSGLLFTVQAFVIISKTRLASVTFSHNHHICQEYIDVLQSELPLLDMYTYLSAVALTLL